MFKLVHNSVYETTLLCALAVCWHLNTAKEKRGVVSIHVQAVSIPITQNIRQKGLQILTVPTNAQLQYYVFHS